MSFVDLVLFGIGLGLTSGICTWVLSDRAAFKRGLIAGLERGHQEGFDVGYQARLFEMTFSEENPPLNTSHRHTVEVIDYEYWVEDMQNSNSYNHKESLATFS